MGVITVTRLDEGLRFGPVPPTLTLADPTVLIGHRTCDTLPDIHTVKLDVMLFSSGDRLVEWVPYVQAARCSTEQNMEATISDVDGQLYFVVLRSVPPNNELLIWYSEQLATKIGVPELSDTYRKGDAYSCPNCSDSFMYPNSLRAHMRFRCRYRQQQQQQQQQQQPMASAASSVRTTLITADDRKRIDDRCSPLNDVASGRRNVTKRSRSSDYSPPDVAPKRVARSPDCMTSLPMTSAGADQSMCRSAFQRVVSPSTPPSPTPALSSTSPDSSGAIWSSPPFTRLGVTSSRPAIPVGLSMTSFGGGLFPFPGTTTVGFGAAATTAAYDARLRSILTSNENISSIYLNSSSAAPSSGLTATAAFHKNINTGCVKPEALTGGRSVHYGAMATADPRFAYHQAVVPTAPMAMEKLFQMVSAAAAAAARQSGPQTATLPSSVAPRAVAAPPGPLPFMLPVAQPPPAVAPITSFPALQLAQNWCAKCNTSFRMTSDLVYHMRTHHKRDLEQSSTGSAAAEGRRKADERNKLRCEVCGETFRERHHLTRHMTSHS